MKTLLKRPLNSYPELSFCFWVGVLSAFGYLIFLSVGAITLLCLCFETEPSFDFEFAQGVFSETAPAAIFAGLGSTILGYLLQGIQTSSKWKWIWLSLLISVLSPSGIFIINQSILQQVALGKWAELFDSWNWYFALGGLAFGLIFWIGTVSLRVFWNYIPNHPEIKAEIA